MFGFKKSKTEEPVSVAVEERPTELALGELTKRAVVGQRTSLPESDLDNDLLRYYDECYAADVISTNGLLPMEASAVVRQKTLLKSAAFEKFLDARYERLDLSILRWRKKDGTPAFGVFDPFNAHPSCTISVSNPEDRMFSFGRTKVLLGSDEAHSLAEFFADLKGYKTFSANWSGMIPPEIRKEIQALKKEASIKCEIIAECDWEVRTIPPDPLVVIRFGSHAWLVAAFDTTPLENYVKSEFAS